MTCTTIARTEMTDLLEIWFMITPENSGDEYCEKSS